MNLYSYPRDDGEHDSFIDAPKTASSSSIESWGGCSSIGSFKTDEETICDSEVTVPHIGFIPIASGNRTPDIGGSFSSKCEQSSSDDFDLDLSVALQKSCLVKEKLSICIPQCEYFLFPSPYPKHIVLQCIQSTFDLLAPAFHSRFDRDKDIWVVYSSVPSMSTRLRIHVYELEGTVNVEMRTEATTEKYGKALFKLLQVSIGLLPDGGSTLSVVTVDQFLGDIGSVILVMSPNNFLSDRELRRSIKSTCRSIQSGTMSELDASCSSIMQTGLFDEYLPSLVDCVGPLIDRLISEDIVGHLNHPSPEIAIKCSKYLKRHSSSCRSPSDVMVNGYTRATSVLKRLATSAECRDEILHHEAFLPFITSLITATMTVPRAFLIRRNLCKVLELLVIRNSHDGRVSGVSKVACSQWLSQMRFGSGEKDVLHDQHVVTSLECILNILDHI